jgi:hypothetical protein
MRLLGPFLLALAMPALASANERSTIPARYYGDWSIAAERCAPGPADSGNIRIGARIIQEFESRMDVRSVFATPNGSIVANGRLTHGEAVYDTAMRLQLLAGGKALGVGEGEEFGRYVRCKP